MSIAHFTGVEFYKEENKIQSTMVYGSRVDTFPRVFMSGAHWLPDVLCGNHHA